MKKTLLQQLLACLNFTLKSEDLSFWYKQKNGLIKRTSSMLDEIESKTIHKDKVINRGKRSKTLSELKPVENISKNLQSFLEISCVQKEVLL